MMKRIRVAVSCASILFSRRFAAFSKGALFKEEREEEVI